MQYKRNRNPDFWKSNRRDCNCGSFALNVTSWFTPYAKEDDEEYSDAERMSTILAMYEENCSLEEIYDAILAFDTEAILKSCPWLERVKLADTKEGDRVIAYRLFINWDDLEWGEVDDDFHFRVRLNGFWFEKCGEEPIRFCGTAADEELWEIATYLVYDSEVIYFRVKDGM